MKRINKHDSIIQNLEHRLQNGTHKYDIFTNIEYGNPNHLTGEMDLVANHYTGKYALYFEIKTNHSEKQYKKAVEQLTRIKDKYASDYQRNFYFYVTKDRLERIML